MTNASPHLGTVFTGGHVALLHAAVLAQPQLVRHAHHLLRDRHQTLDRLLIMEVSTKFREISEKVLISRQDEGHSRTLIKI